MHVAVVIGEEVTTRGGHLLGLFLEERVRPLRSLRSTIAAIHEQGGLAIPAHPLVPYPLCAQGPVLRRLLADADPLVRPDGLETFNPTTLGRPWHGRVVRFAAEHDLATVGNSDAHAAEQVGQCWSTFPGRTPEDLRLAILGRSTHGARQLPWPRLDGRDVRAAASQVRSRRSRRASVGAVRRDGTGRDLGYPGGRRRPAALRVRDEERPG